MGELVDRRGWSESLIRRFRLPKRGRLQGLPGTGTVENINHSDWSAYRGCVGCNSWATAYRLIELVVLLEPSALVTRTPVDPPGTLIAQPKGPSPLQRIW